VARPVLLGLLGLQDSPVILGVRDSRVGLAGLVQQEPMVTQETLDGLELQVQKVSKEYGGILDSLDHLELLDRLVQLGHRASLEMPAHKVLLEALDSQAVLARLAIQVITWSFIAVFSL